MSAHHHCASESDTHLAQEPRYRKVLWIALIVNASMFVVEIIASQTSHSMSLQADALDFFGDSANYMITLFVLNMGVQWRSRAGLFKGLSMAAFGVFVLISALLRFQSGEVPVASTMGLIGALALVANVFVAVLLFSFRGGDSNMRSIWLCSRNDAIGNLMVIAAAVGVFSSATRWPDLGVAIVIASLSLSAAYQVIRLSRAELQEFAKHQ